MKRFALILAVLLCVALVLPVAVLGSGADLQLLSGYYGIDYNNGLLGQVAPGTSETTLFSRLFASDKLSLSNGVKTGSVLSVGSTPCMTLAVQADCSGDGAFSVTDMLMVKSKLLGQQSFTKAQTQAADVTGDGDVTISDFLKMKSKILGLSSFALRPVAGGEREESILLAVGETAAYGAAGDSVTVEGSAATWDAGTVTAKAVGTARLTKGSETLLVTVCSEGMRISLPDAEISLKKDQTYQLTPTINHPVEARITYTVSDPSVITVSADGLVTAVGSGTAKVTATLPGGASDSQSVTVRRAYTVCIDAGHQKAPIYDKEPNGPGSSEMKAKLSAGTQGVVTRIPEYQLNLDIALMLKQELIKRGYDVIMIRETNDCPISNAERAVIANESGADIFVRIHANGSSNPDVHGALCCAPTTKNPYLTDENIAESRRLSQVLIDAYCKRTGAKNKGLYNVDTMTGINWCEIPVTIVEMGYMSNAAEDKKMATDAYRQKMMLGIADGIDAYFAGE